MRIIAGRYRGRHICYPRGIRPTKDNVKEAVFNVIAAYVKDAKVLDLFAGSGGLGIEALSRGACSVSFVDNSKQCIKVIRDNIERLKPDDIKKTTFLNSDTLAAIRLLHKGNEAFDIVILDPPYYKNWIKKCLKNISVYDILTPSGLVIAEHFKKEAPPEQVEYLRQIRQLRYGDTVISIYKKPAWPAGREKL